MVVTENYTIFYPSSIVQAWHEDLKSKPQDEESFLVTHPRDTWQFPHQGAYTHTHRHTYTQRRHRLRLP